MQVVKWNMTRGLKGEVKRVFPFRGYRGPERTRFLVHASAVDFVSPMKIRLYRRGTLNHHLKAAKLRWEVKLSDQIVPRQWLVPAACLNPGCRS